MAWKRKKKERRREKKVIRKCEEIVKNRKYLKD